MCADYSGWVSVLRQFYANDWQRLAATFGEQLGNTANLPANDFRYIAHAADLDMVGVTGSIPVPPTTFQALSDPFQNPANDCQRYALRNALALAVWNSGEWCP
jgi:hypothetical protein